MAYDKVVAAITLAGSAVSAVATACVLVCFILFRENQRSLRHALVLNLTISDFINSATNTVSGSIFMKNHKLTATPACTFNGWIEQLSVQATDFSILAISIATLSVVRRKVQLGKVSKLQKFVACLSTWIVPFITSIVATAMGQMKPVSGNWCWISEARTDLRYGLTHGWRFAIIAITIGIYSYVWWYVSRHFRSLRGMHDSVFSGNHVLESIHSPVTAQNKPNSTNAVRVTTDYSVHVERKFPIKESDATSQISNVGYTPSDAPSSRMSQELLSPGKLAASHQFSHDATVLGPSTSDADHFANSNAKYAREQSRQAERDVKRMLMMNGYPIMYVILWIPGMINRIIEASGGHASSRVLAILQCSTQFVGFANAVTYGLSGVWRKER
ncbi:hypothetical protein EJ04DRAFT_603179 [Polyplosphaeria fusca]|uniref:G-protein coupled receptors family 2 profile 2 domain-containing protein n=1 Tax=Polyplosphaeria fusca TaxID=682080 RepID=A0A9P4R091_9PLEO|nr:hypothetical protein EJ04DRAFT_603179 [Polyplosphaeria fusca]